MRLRHSPEDAKFSEWLLDVRHGHSIDDKGMIDIPSSMVTFNKDVLINKIYEGIQDIQLTPPPINYFLDHAILAPQNIDVHETNEKILQRMPGSEIICHSANMLEDEGEGIPNDIPQEFLRSLDPSSFPLLELKMKIGCPLILIRNLDPGNGL